MSGNLVCQMPGCQTAAGCVCRLSGIVTISRTDTVEECAALIERYAESYQTEGGAWFNELPEKLKYGYQASCLRYMAKMLRHDLLRTVGSSAPSDQREYAHNSSSSPPPANTRGSGRR